MKSERTQIGRAKTEIWIPDPSSPGYPSEDCVAESHDYMPQGLFPIHCPPEKPVARFSLVEGHPMMVFQFDDMFI